MLQHKQVLIIIVVVVIIIVLIVAIVFKLMKLYTPKLSHNIRTYVRTYTHNKLVVGLSPGPEVLQ